LVIKQIYRDHVRQVPHLRPMARTHIRDPLNRLLPSTPVTRKPSRRVSPMTEGKVLAIILMCYGVLLLAMLYFFPERVMP
jgi:hypothetical protein